MSHDVALALELLAIIALAFFLREQRKRNRYLHDLLDEERAARALAERLTTKVVHAVEPILQKTAWSMGELAHYTVRAQEVARNDIVDRIRRDLRAFNLPDATKGGSYGDLALLKPDTRGGQNPNRPYAEGTS